MIRHRCHRYGEIWGGVGDEVWCRCHRYGEVWEMRCGVGVRYGEIWEVWEMRCGVGVIGMGRCGR